MATSLLMMSGDPSRWAEWLLAVLIAWFVSALIIYFASYFAKFLGEKGLIAIERLMGMLLIRGLSKIKKNRNVRKIEPQRHRVCFVELNSK